MPKNTRAHNTRTKDSKYGINPITSDMIEYSADEVEFIMAMDRYKRENNQPYPTWVEVLEVAKSLGYRRVEDGPLDKK